MLNNRSPPQYKQLTAGGSSSGSVNTNTNTSAATAGSYGSSRSSSVSSLHHYQPAYSQQSHSHSCYHHQQQQQQQQQQKQSHHHGSRTSLTPTMKRGKKNWGSRERSGMSFLIVIAFFAIFGLIILTEVFMIDERSHSGMLAMRAGGGGGGAGFGGRMGDSMPDYDNVKDDYDLLDAGILSDNKLGFIQFRDNKLKIQEAAGTDGHRSAGTLLNSGYGGGGAFGMGIGQVLAMIPFGQILPSKVEVTLPRFPIGTTPRDGAWQIVNGTRFKFFVYSAYYDRRDGARLVRVVGATKTRGPAERVWCRFWYTPKHSNTSEGETAANGGRAKHSSITVMARVKIIRENWNLKYSACFVLCPVRTPMVDVPQFVSVVSRLRAPPGNLIQLRSTDEDPDFAPPATTTGNSSSSSTSSKSSNQPHLHAPPSGDRIPDRIAVCVKPFHFNYDQALYLIEYLEFYALLGVSHFTFYNHTLGPHASCVVQSYVDGDVPGNLTAYDLQPLTPLEQANNATPRVLKSLHYSRPTVSILPWNLRMRSQKEIRTEGLFAALNDCLYRTMYRYKYLALVDLDEFIVPRYTDTLNELIGSLNLRFRNRNTGAYSFQNAFYYLQFADDPLASTDLGGATNEQMTQVRASLVTQRKTRRRYKLHPQKQRSKFICKPEAVVEAGNHFVWEFAPGKGSLNVPPKEAILQHYRVCEFGGNDCIIAPSIVDRTTTKYVNRLVQRVHLVYRHLQQRCDLPPLPALPPKRPVKREQKRSDNIVNKPNVPETVHTVTTKKSTTTTTATTVTVTTKANQIDGGLFQKPGIQSDREPLPKASENLNEAASPLNARKKRKMIVFELNDTNGLPVARVEYQ